METFKLIARLLLLVAVLVCTAGFAPLAASAQDPEPVNIRITQVDTSQFPKVTVYVSATNANGEPVSVPRSQLVLTENGQEMRLEEIKGVGDNDEPLTTLLVMDVSGSMNAAGKLGSAKSAARNYINQTRPNDLIGILAFNTRLNYARPITQNREDLFRALDDLTAKDDTALYDALIEGIKILEGMPGRKTIIALTDGMDNRSKASPKKVIDRIGPEGVSISTIGLGDPEYNKGNLAGLDEAALTYLADHAGGLYGYANDASTLSNLYERYGRALQSEYALTYTSPSTLRDGVNRSLNISLKEGGAAASEDKYNPGGLVPEVSQPASWWLFAGLLVLLAALLALPVILRMLPKAQKQAAGRVKLMGGGGSSSKKSPKIRFKS